MREHLDLTSGLIVSERLVAAFEPLVGRGEARRLLTRASRRAAAGALPLAEALAGEPALAGSLSGAQLKELLDPTGHLGAATALTDRALRHRRTAPPGATAPTRAAAAHTAPTRAAPTRAAPTPAAPPHTYDATSVPDDVTPEDHRS